MHFPEPMYPFDIVTADVPYRALGQANTRIFALPPALGIDHRVLNGYVYMSFNGVGRPGRDRPPRRGLRQARWLLLRAVGRTVRALGNQGPRDHRRD